MKFKKSGSIILLLLIVSILHAQEPVFRLKDLNNQWKEFEDLKGSKLTVIDFWATWCQPCLRLIPQLNEMSEEFTPKGVNFIGVSVDGTRNQSKIQPFTQSLGVSYPILRDVNSDLMLDLGVSVVPTLMVYDVEGELIFFHEGYRPGDEDIIRKHLETYLAE